MGAGKGGWCRGLGGSAVSKLAPLGTASSSRQQRINNPGLTVSQREPCKMIDEVEGGSFFKSWCLPSSYKMFHCAAFEVAGRAWLFRLYLPFSFSDCEARKLSAFEPNPSLKSYGLQSAASYALLPT
jgi:hypothetical protein